MKLRYRILAGLGATVVLAVGSFAIAVSYDSACPAAPSRLEGPQQMRAIVQRCYGPPRLLAVEQVAKPVPADDEIVVRVHAAAANPYDWHRMTGTPYVARLSFGLGAPSDGRLGGDFAGTVDTVGRNVTRFKPGDRVFGNKRGAFAEYVLVREQGTVTHQPQQLTFEQAAAMPLAAITALQAVRDNARIRAGQKVLVNGASGGVGTYAVQIARFYDAEVTGVCSTRNVDMVRSLGAHHVTDYTQQSLTEQAERYDVIIDTVGNHALLDLRRVLKPQGIAVLVGGSKRDPWLGPLWSAVKAGVLSRFIDEEFVKFVARLNAEDLDFLVGLARAGNLRPVIDRRYALSEVPAALEYLAGRHARGKVIVRMH